MSDVLSPTMQSAVRYMQVSVGGLIRHPGGFWSSRAERVHSYNGRPERYFGTPTVQALVERGWAEYTEWKEGRSGRFPIGACLTRRGAESLP